jgi:hypothetical protein
VLLIAEFSSLFVAEWGIQIVGASQASCALELIVLMKGITSSESESSESRKKFAKLRWWIRAGLTILASVIIIVPIAFIIESTVIFNKEGRNYFNLSRNKAYLNL